jgi:hypothetical protein
VKPFDMGTLLTNWAPMLRGWMVRLRSWKRIRLSATTRDMLTNLTTEYFLTHSAQYEIYSIVSPKINSRDSEVLSTYVVAEI